MSHLMHELSSEEKDEIYKCLCAADDEKIFPEWEFETLFGVNRKTLRNARDRWPEIDLNDPDIKAVIMGSMANLLGYPWDKTLVLENHLSVSTEKIRAVLERLTKCGL